MNKEAFYKELRMADETVESLSLKIGIAPSTMYRKIAKNGETFTISDVKLIVSNLNLSQKKTKDIFF